MFYMENIFKENIEWLMARAVFLFFPDTFRKLKFMFSG